MQEEAIRGAVNEAQIRSTVGGAALERQQHHFDMVLALLVLLFGLMWAAALWV
jgi:hypothetical protein